MNYKNVADREKYINLFIQFSSLLNCSLSEIKDKYESYPHCITSYFEKAQWIASNFYVGIKEFPRNYNQSCFMITANVHFNLK